MKPEQTTRRLFFALWPDKVLQSQMQKVAKQYLSDTGGRLVPLANLHITLAYVGAVDETQQQCLVAVASQIKVEPFVLTLSELGFFKRAQVAWLSCKTLPAALSQLQHSLVTELSACGYQAEPRPYTPHVTLKRKAKQRAACDNIAAISWYVDRFVLVESVTQPSGVRYDILNQWSLTLTDY